MSSGEQSPSSSRDRRRREDIYDLNTRLSGVEYTAQANITRIGELASLVSVLQTSLADMQKTDEIAEAVKLALRGEDGNRWTKRERAFAYLGAAAILFQMFLSVIGIILATGR